MADIDLENMTLDELKQLEKDVSKAIKSFETRRKAEARAAAEAVARDMGFSLAELAEGAKTKGAPKYQHPENPELTWTGRAANQNGSSKPSKTDQPPMNSPSDNRQHMRNEQSTPIPG